MFDKVLRCCEALCSFFICAFLFALFFGSGTLTVHFIDKAFVDPFPMVNSIWALYRPAVLWCNFFVESTYPILQLLCCLLSLALYSKLALQGIL